MYIYIYILFIYKKAPGYVLLCSCRQEQLSRCGAVDLNVENANDLSLLFGGVVRTLAMKIQEAVSQVGDIGVEFSMYQVAGSIGS